MISNVMGQPSRHLVISIDDYAEANVPLAHRIRELGLLGTFYIELLNNQDARGQIKTLSGMDMEIGSHTLTHPMDIKQVPLEQARSEIEVSKRMIEEITDAPCLSFAYPRGRYNDQTVELVRAAGYQDARTTEVLRIGPAADQFRKGTTVHVFERKEYGGRGWLQIAQAQWAKVMEAGGVFSVWGHAREMARDGNTDAFIDFLRQCKQDAGITGYDFI